MTGEETDLRIGNQQLRNKVAQSKEQLENLTPAITSQGEDLA